ncbi:uncharacterized protein LOC101852534 [Aplysia californica]|uniref:Uncharacterized protein LOC101852534 n=1 Tax=Aplysia californica TaxID=6500 RepID=A0ABM0KAT3_APLCA|nr:uncharacterized protein LOC101852534 [Aplysia californica]
MSSQSVEPMAITPVARTVVTDVDRNSWSSHIHQLKHKVLILPPDFENMPHTFFRLIHKARSRSQRRRVYAWVLCVLALVFFILYTNQSALLAYTGGTASNIIPSSQIDAGNAVIDFHNKAPAQPEAGQDNNIRERMLSRRAPDMKLLGAADANMQVDEGDDDDMDESQADLLPDLSPAIVHIIWCGRKRTFDFRHYLSMKRAYHLIKPDKMIFHYQKLPTGDTELYYNWFDLIKSEIDSIVFRPLNTSRCDTSGPHRYMLALSLLEQFGGIFVPEDAILVDFPVHLRASPFVSGVVAKTLTEYLDGVIVAKKKGFISPSSQSGLNIVLASGRSAAQGIIDPCGTVKHFSEEEDGDCLCVKVEEEIFPKDIWEANTRFGTLARLAAYGTNEVKATSRNSLRRTSIPKIGHYICWDCDLKFTTYISVMSSLYVAGLSKVYIHGLNSPSGLWWSKLQETERVVHVLRDYPEHSQDNAAMTQELAQGIMRVSILLKYGGVYCDDKVIWTSPIPEEYFSYEAVAAPDWHQYGTWPDSVSHTTIMAKAKSQYLLKLRNLYYQHHNRKFWFIDQFLAYKILEQSPELLRLDRRFQVKCLNKNCHPTWVENYKVPMNENPQGVQFDWQSDTLSVYWDVFPDLELDAVKYTSGPIVDAARRALQKAGISVQELKNR